MTSVTALLESYISCPCNRRLDRAILCIPFEVSFDGQLGFRMSVPNAVPLSVEPRSYKSLVSLESEGAPYRFRLCRSVTLDRWRCPPLIGQKPSRSVEEQIPFLSSWLAFLIRDDCSSKSARQRLRQSLHDIYRVEFPISGVDAANSWNRDNDPVKSEGLSHKVSSCQQFKAIDFNDNNE